MKLTDPLAMSILSTRLASRLAPATCLFGEIVPCSADVKKDIEEKTWQLGRVAKCATDVAT